MEPWRTSFGNSIHGLLDGRSWEQAQCNVRDGGLGISTATDMRFPAVVSSLTTSRPGAFEWFSDLERAGLVSEGSLQDLYDTRAENAEVCLRECCKDAPCGRCSLLE